jgi:glycosyltransferase involved in cell wall biosynthesis
VNDSIACVIPALNAAASLGTVARGLRAALPGAIIIGVDDGSSDQTAAVIRAHCDRAILFGSNRGKGAALRAGFADALAQRADIVLALDADGQHDPARAPSLVAALDGADVVIGARGRGVGAMPLRRRMTNALSTAAARRLAGCELADPQSGYRAMRAVVVREVRARGDRYEFETDFLLRAARAGFRIAAVPIPTIYGPPSHFREMRDGFRVVATFWRHAWGGALE